MATLIFFRSPYSRPPSFAMSIATFPSPLVQAHALINQTFQQVFSSPISSFFEKLFRWILINCPNVTFLALILRQIVDEDLETNAIDSREDIFILLRPALAIRSGEDARRTDTNKWSRSDKSASLRLVENLIPCHCTEHGACRGGGRISRRPERSKRNQRKHAN